MSSGIFLLQKDGSLIEMEPKEYDSEDILQTLLAEYPNLLAGDQIDELNPRRWILVSREISIPDDLDAEGRWSLDHLFLDQDGVPTLVEVKRSKDTRIRREVVGQMLDYAANAASYWDVDRIMSQYEANCEKDGLDPQQVWADRLQLEESYDEYWGKVSQNLQTGKMRMMFVADEIPFELKRVVEFLNEQMKPAEVLALEIKQYISESHKTLIPRLYGQSSKLQLKKAGRSLPAKQWDEASFIRKLEEREGQAAIRLYSRVMVWAKENGLDTWYGYGLINGSYYPLVRYDGESVSPFTLWTHGLIEIQFGRMKKCPVYNDSKKRRQLYDKLNSIPGVSLSNENIDGYPTLPMSSLYDESSMNLFLNIWEEFIREIRVHTQR